MPPLTSAGGARAIAIASVLLALATPVAEFIPFSANGSWRGHRDLWPRLIAHDGLIALIGWIVVAVTVGLAAYGAM